MPGRFTETLDDPEIFDGTPDFNGGAMSYARRNLLAPNQAFKLVNVMLAKDGPAVTRRGTLKLGVAADYNSPVLGMGYLDTPSLEKLLRIAKSTSGGHAVIVQSHDGNPANDWVTEGSYTPADADMEIVPALNKLYLFNGSDAVHTWDGTSFATLGTSGTDCPKGKWAVWFQYRMFVAGVAASPYTVFFSDVLDPSNGHWDATAKSFKVSEGDGDPIVGIAPWTGTLLVIFKRSSIWLADVDPTISLGGGIALQCIHRGVGCLSHRSIAQVGADLWFASDDGPRSVQRILQGDQQAVSLPLSRPVQDRWDRLNKSAADKICATFFNNRYLIAFPTENATRPDEVLSFNTEKNCWEGYWTGWTPTIFCASYFGGLQRMQMGRADGQVMQWRNFTAEENETELDFVDGAVDIPTTIGLRSHNFDEPRNRKRGVVVELEFDRSRARTVDLALILDERTTSIDLGSIASGIGAVTFPMRFPFRFTGTGIKRVPRTLLDQPPFREIALEISSTKRKLALRSVALTAHLRGMTLGQ
ncbi:MAG TPA: hypothetical protein VG838_00475 [Opitutaceae bacterium]|nr:hypothetical protein [Opitutaceae bacterium]